MKGVFHCVGVSEGGREFSGYTVVFCEQCVTSVCCIALYSNLNRARQELRALGLLWVVLKRTFGLCVGRSVGQRVYLELVYLVTALEIGRAHV